MTLLGALAKLLRPSAFQKPELLFRPGQIFRRLRWKSIRLKETLSLEIAWGLTVNCSPGERIGEALAKTGSYDTGVLEILARLVDPGERSLDVGANFGLMTSVMGLAAGGDGRVDAFEPHPVLRGRLSDHLASWRAEAANFAEVEVHDSAVSDEDGEATLHMPANFSANEGTASLEEQGEDGDSFTVPTVRLDGLFAGSDVEIGVMKIDIEGHEKAALEGAAGLLGRHAVRDIVYEDHEGYPSAVSELLEGHGYEVFRIEKGLFGPALSPPGVVRKALPNFLATADPERARRRASARGYRVLSGQLNSKGEG